MVIEVRERVQFFNPWRLPNSYRARELIQQIIRAIHLLENRKRARRRADALRFEGAVTALICDLLYRAATGSPSLILVERSHQSLERRRGRYDHPALTGSFPKIQDQLLKLGLIGLELGQRSAADKLPKRTKIWATPDLLERLPDPVPEDFCLDPSEEIVILRDTKARVGDGPGEQIEYVDDETTHRTRAQLRALNDFIANADIEFDDGCGRPTRQIDPHCRRLYRIFSNRSFDSGGRLFRAFWIDLPKAVRREGLFIDGDPIVTLDYGQMAIRLAYAAVGVAPPAGDLYRTGDLQTWSREAAKKLVNAALYTAKPLKTKPKATAASLPQQSIGELMGKLREAHAPIAHLFETGEGLRLQRKESDIILGVLDLLMKRDIVALPIHDAIIVKASAADEAEAAMHSVFQEMTASSAQVCRE